MYESRLQHPRCGSRCLGSGLMCLYHQRHRALGIRAHKGACCNCPSSSRIEDPEGLRTRRACNEAPLGQEGQLIEQGRSPGDGYIPCSWKTFTTPKAKALLVTQLREELLCSWSPTEGTRCRMIQAHYQCRAQLGRSPALR